MCSIATLLTTGNAPGNARHTGHTLVFGSPPNSFGHPQNILLLVLSSTWHSMPMTLRIFSALRSCSIPRGRTVKIVQFVALACCVACS